MISHFNSPSSQKAVDFPKQPPWTKTPEELKFLTDHYPGFVAMQLKSGNSHNREELSENFWKNIYREFFEKWPNIVVPPDVSAAFPGDKAKARMKEYKEEVITVFIHNKNFKLTVHSEDIFMVL